jgi:hypothetical protein
MQVAGCGGEDAGGRVIFSDFQRTDNTPKLSQFEFLDRSAWPEVGRKRAFLEELLLSYPADEQKEIVARIQSRDDRHFASAFFELVLYGYLKRLGCSLRPHPVLNTGSSARPDFLVTTPTGEEFYVEAVLASQRESKNSAADARIGTTVDLLSRASHPNFMIGIDMSGAPETPPRGTRLKNDVLRWLDTLNPEEVRACFEKGSFSSLPTLTWKHETWEVTVSAFPIKEGGKGQPMTFIAWMNGKGGFINKWSPIRDAIRSKGSKYGDLKRPLLVAVNSIPFHLDRIDEMQALYGQEQFYFDVNDASRTPYFHRAPNGAWAGTTGPRGLRVSGAWLFSNLSLYNLPLCRSTLYFNQWATYPLPTLLRQLPHAMERDGKIHGYGGLTLKQCFELPEHWLDSV